MKRNWRCTSVMKTDAIFVGRVNYVSGIRGLIEVYIRRSRRSSVSEMLWPPRHGM